MERKGEEDTVVAAVRAGDESAFSALVERHRWELQVHCYRLLGSFEDAEDLVQETFLRAWRRRASFEGRSTFRAWLYRIATNARLDFLDRHRRRPRPRPVDATMEPGTGSAPPAEILWLQPYPDRLLDAVAASDAGPDAAVIAKETIELAFLAAIQHLPPRQRAVLILRDVLGWPANDTATLLEVSVPAVKSMRQRARSTLKAHLPPRRVVVLAPDRTLGYDALEWRGAIVVVDQGEIGLECLDGSRRCFGRGAVLWLERLPLRALHNRGSESAVLVAVSRRAARTETPGSRSCRYEDAAVR